MLEVKKLRIDYKKKAVLKNVNLTIAPGQSYALLGQSGSGKTTLAKAIAGFVIPTAGTITIDGEPVRPISWAKPQLEARRKVQMIFQDPYASLNPKHTIKQILSEPFIVHGLQPDETKILELLDNVNLDKNILHRYPNSFSGGQRQRIALARALAITPKLLILDESLSALDVVMQKQLIHILKTIQKNTHTAYLFITHQTKNAEDLCDAIGYLEDGVL